MRVGYDVVGAHIHALILAGGTDEYPADMTMAQALKIYFANEMGGRKPAARETREFYRGWRVAEVTSLLNELLWRVRVLNKDELAELAAELEPIVRKYDGREGQS